MSPSELPDLLRAAVARLAPVIPVGQELGRRFAEAGHELALVGGPVRDAFIGRTSPDLDFTTDATPDETLAVILGWADAHWEIGKAFGTIGLRKGKYVIEVTTYRSDVYDRTSRKPSVTFGTTLSGDLVRRDFTVNAMAVRFPSLEFVDEHGGLADLAARVLRTPSAPEESFADDPLRMLRAARFASQLGFTVAPDVQAAMTASAESLSMVSAERIREELTKLLMSDSPRAGLTLLVDTGLAEVFLPELPALQLEVDEHHHHKDVYQHSLTVLEQAIRLEGPRSGRGRSGDGGGSRPGAAARGAAARRGQAGHAAVRGRRGASRSTTTRWSARSWSPSGSRRCGTTRRRSRRSRSWSSCTCGSTGTATGEWTDSAVRRYITDAGPLLPRLHLLTRSDSTTRNARKAQWLARTYDDLEARIETLKAAEELAAVRPELDGNEIGEILGVPPGRVIGDAYKFLLGVRLDEGIIGPDAARERLLAWWAERNG